MIEFYGTDQSTTEIRTHYIDFTDDMPAGVTVSSATATLTAYPSGGTATLSVGVIASNVVPVTVTSPTVAGQYVIDVLATLSDAEKSAARLIVQVFWTASRAGMNTLVATLRGMTDAGANDYTVGGLRYWSDDQLEEYIDRYQSIYDFVDMSSLAQRSGSSYVYKIFTTGVKNWESPPVIMDSAGSVIASGYAFDSARGMCTFTADQAGSARYISGTAYNLNAAAADVWRLKYGHYAGAYDVVTDNHNLKRSQLMAQAKQMIAYYSFMAAGSGGGQIDIERSDT